MSETTCYTETEIAEAVKEYATFHAIETSEVDVCRTFDGDSEKVIGYRLSRDVDGRQHGDDEQYGQC